MATSASARVLAALALPSTAAYERGRAAYLRHMTAVKRQRRVRLGPHAAVLFENLETVRAQILEVLHVEGDTPSRRLRLADEYACLLPVPGELRATLLLDGDAMDVARSLARGASRRGGLALHTTLGTFNSSPAEAAGDLGAVHYLAFVLTTPPRRSTSWRLRALATDDADAVIDVAVDDAVRDALTDELHVVAPPGWQIFASRPVTRTEEASVPWPF
jgi:hypothetical protein